MGDPPSRFACIILAAGQGTRIQSKHPKVLHELGKKPMIRHVADAVVAAGADRIALVVSPDNQLAVGQHVPEACTVLQPASRGTGDAVKFARAALRDSNSEKDFTGDVVVVFGDTPLLNADLIQRMRPSISGEDVAISVAGVQMPQDSHFGRLVTDANTNLVEIVEYRDASEAVRNQTLCNGGVMGIQGSVLWDLLDEIEPSSESGEFYLTHIVASAHARGLTSRIVEMDHKACFGVNTRADLAQAESFLQDRLRQTFMENGVTLRAPETIWFAADTKIGKDVTIEPYVTFGPGVVIEDNVEIKSYCDFKGCHIASGSIVGPFARLRVGANIGEKARIGNFVEIKASDICEGAKISHLSYIGDARVGREANIGAGVITCNYDGVKKHFTDIGDFVFVGSNSALIAPVRLGERATVGAGSVITADVPSETLAFERTTQSHKTGWVRKPKT